MSGRESVCHQLLHYDVENKQTSHQIYFRVVFCIFLIGSVNFSCSSEGWIYFNREGDFSTTWRDRLEALFYMGAFLYEQGVNLCGNYKELAVLHCFALSHSYTVSFDCDKR